MRDVKSPYVGGSNCDHPSIAPMSAFDGCGHRSTCRLS
jgi:hypothetical protein